MLTNRNLSKSARVPINRQVETSSEDDSQVENDSDSSKPEIVESYHWNNRDAKLKINNKSFTVLCEQDKTVAPRYVPPSTLEALAGVRSNPLNFIKQLKYKYARQHEDKSRKKRKK